MSREYPQLWASTMSKMRSLLRRAEPAATLKVPTEGEPTSNLWNELFDRVYVVSLPDAIERRTYVEKHLKSNGIVNFEWHDAFGPEHPEVDRIFENGKVHLYPPCFRCGKESCGLEDCNNVLLPAQVAVFMTYLALWKKIASRDERALVVEDDVQLHRAWRNVLPFLKAKIDSGALPFQPENRCLLRLGWALGKDHDRRGRVKLKTDIRMSNPCYALTSAFAAKAVAEFKTVYHTADVYLHKDLPSPQEAFTVFPPIASDLSWSTGELPSFIHPKALHAEHLRRKGDTERADDYARIVDGHIKHLYHRRFLILGHPRCGTGFAATMFGQFGFDVGHENDGRDGIASWMFAVEDDAPWAKAPIARNRKALMTDHVIQTVRDPLTAVPSIMRENDHAPASLEYRRRHILTAFGVDLLKFDNRMDAAVASLCLWSQLIAKQSPALFFRIESDVDKVATYVRNHYAGPEIDVATLDLSPVNSDKKYKGKRYSKDVLTRDDWLSLSDETAAWLAAYCQTYGYPMPIGQS